MKQKMALMRKNDQIQKMAQEVAKWKNMAMEACEIVCDRCDRADEDLEACETCRITRIMEDVGK